MEYINRLFNEDNLELLEQLPNESIDLIYCDILYNTGKNFKDYNDNLGTPLVAAKELGRNYIGCDIGEKAIEITKDRLSKIA